MRVRVTITETKTIERTYEIDGVNSLETAAKCAERCAKRQYQPNAYLYREIPQAPQYNVTGYEVVNPG